MLLSPSNIMKYIFENLESGLWVVLKLGPIGWPRHFPLDHQKVWLQYMPTSANWVTIHKMDEQCGIFRYHSAPIDPTFCLNLHKSKFPNRADLSAFCFNAMTEVKFEGLFWLVLASKIKILSWKFVGSLLLNIPTFRRGIRTYKIILLLFLHISSNKKFENLPQKFPNRAGPTCTFCFNNFVVF